MKRKSVLSLFAILAVLCLLTDCGSRNVTPGAIDEPSPDDPPTFAFTRDDFPRLDGSTATVPLGQAIASVLLGEPRAKASELIHFSKTTRSYRALMNGEADVILAAEPASAVLDEKNDGGCEWEMSRFAVDALVFLVNADNPVDGLTSDQIRGIYRGDITNWAQVGGADMEITAFQRTDEAGSQTAMENLVMRGEPMADAPTELVRGEMGDLLRAVAAFDNSPSALGYTMYYYAHNMEIADGVKILSVDGVAPDAQTIRDGSYPFLNGYYVVTDAGRAANDPAKLLYDWILSADGKRLIEHEGYVPAEETEGTS